MRRRARSVQNRFTMLQNNLLNYHKKEEKKQDENEDSKDIAMTNDDNQPLNINRIRSDQLPEFLAKGKVKVYIEQKTGEYLYVKDTGECFV